MLPSGRIASLINVDGPNDGRKGLGHHLVGVLGRLGVVPYPPQGLEHTCREMVERKRNKKESLEKNAHVVFVIEEENGET